MIVAISKSSVLQLTRSGRRQSERKLREDFWDVSCRVPRQLSANNISPYLWRSWTSFVAATIGHRALQNIDQVSSGFPARSKSMGLENLEWRRNRCCMRKPEPGSDRASP